MLIIKYYHYGLGLALVMQILQLEVLIGVETDTLVSQFLFVFLKKCCKEQFSKVDKVELDPNSGTAAKTVFGLFLSCLNWTPPTQLKLFFFSRFSIELSV